MRKRIACILSCMLIFTSVLTAIVHANTASLKGGELNIAQDLMNLDNTSKSEELFSFLTPDTPATITLTPYNPPVKISPSGGSFDYNIAVSNNKATPLTFTVWTMVVLPNGNLYGPIIRVQITLPGDWSANGDLTLDIPDYAPAGNYTYYGIVGIYPNEIWDSNSFTFEKLSSGGWYTQYYDVYIPYLSSVFFTDANNGWAVGSRVTILHTENGGNDWYPQTSQVFSAFTDVFFTDDDTGWAVGDLNVIIHTTDGGDNWIVQRRTEYPKVVWGGVYFIDENTGWAVGGASPTFQSAKRAILHTTDGGDNWNTQLYETYEWPLSSVYFVDANTGWAVGDLGAILHTTDGGNNWYPQTSGTSNHLASVKFTDANSGWIVGRDGTILHTTDGGDHWSPQTSGTSLSLGDVFFVDDETGWAVGSDGIVLHTTNAGNNWLPQTSGTNNSLASICFIDDKTGWATGLYGTIIHTTTGGEG